MYKIYRAWNILYISVCWYRAFLNSDSRFKTLKWRAEFHESRISKVSEIPGIKGSAESIKYETV